MVPSLPNEVIHTNSRQLRKINKRAKWLPY
jgi:hypothetical protein